MSYFGVGELPGTPLDIDSQGLAILIRSHLEVNHLKKARALFEDAQVFFPHLKLGPEPFEAFMYFYAVKKGHVNRCEEVMELMAAEGIPPTDSILASLVICYLNFQRPHDALEHILDLYAQHKLRPRTANFLRLLDYSLEKGDEAEARRVVEAICHMYSPAERNQMLGSRDEEYLSDSPSHSEYVPAEVDMNRHWESREVLRDDFNYWDEDWDEEYQLYLEEQKMKEQQQQEEGEEAELGEEGDEVDESEEEFTAEDSVDNADHHHSEDDDHKFADDLRATDLHIDSAVETQEDMNESSEVAPSESVEGDTSEYPYGLGEDGDDLFTDLLSKRMDAIKEAEEESEERKQWRKVRGYHMKLAYSSRADRLEFAEKVLKKDKSVFYSRGWLAKHPKKPVLRVQLFPQKPFVVGVLSDSQLEARFRKYGLKLFD